MDYVDKLPNQLRPSIKPPNWPHVRPPLTVPPRRINEICLGKRAITPDTALRLARYFGMSAEFWMTLQQRFDLECAKDKLDARLDKEVRPLEQVIA